MRAVTQESRRLVGIGWSLRDEREEHDAGQRSKGHTLVSWWRAAGRLAWRRLQGSPSDDALDGRWGSTLPTRGAPGLAASRVCWAWLRCMRALLSSSSRYVCVFTSSHITVTVCREPCVSRRARR